VMSQARTGWFSDPEKRSEPTRQATVLLPGDRRGDSAHARPGRARLLMVACACSPTKCRMNHAGDAALEILTPKGRLKAG
jgi:hypothetical protein